MRPTRRALPTLAEAQAAGFVVGGEPLALDLVDTLITVTDPPTELLAGDERARQFWALQQVRLPAGAKPPELNATRRLGAAIRALLESRMADLAPPTEAVELINAMAGAGGRTPRGCGPALAH